MASFFSNGQSFSSWLNSKSESELKTMLTRADSRARLNGSKNALVSRVVEVSRNLRSVDQLRVFPELRHRQQAVPNGSRATGQVRGGAITEQPNGERARERNSADIAASRRRNEITAAATLPRLGSAVTRIPRVLPAEVQPISRQQTIARSLPRVGSIVSNRRAQAELVGAPRRPTEVASPSRVHPRGARQVQPRSTESLQHHPPPRPLPVFHNPRLQAIQGQDSPQFIQAIIANSGNPVVQNPEQILQERLEVHAGLIIQSIAHSLTPRNRRNSMSTLGAAANSPTRPRAASTSSAEKTGPDVDLGEEEIYRNKLECKICFDAAVNTVLLPCGHACCCQDCSVRLKFATWNAKCPICRTRIDKISMLYFS